MLHGFTLEVRRPVVDGGVVLDFQGLHWRLEEGNLDPKEVEIARAGQVCGKGGGGVDK